jgi:hypothetical protein
VIARVKRREATRILNHIHRKSRAVGGGSALHSAAVRLAIARQGDPFFSVGFELARHIL